MDISNILVASILSAALFFGWRTSSNIQSLPIPVPQSEVQQVTGDIFRSKQTNTPSKVIDKDASNLTVNWKTYRNEKYGFEFKYPISILNTPKIQEIEKGVVRITLNFMSEKVADYDALKAGDIIHPGLDINITDKSSNLFYYPDYSQNPDYNKIIIGGQIGYKPRIGGRGARNIVTAIKLSDSSFISSMSLDTRKVITGGKSSIEFEALEDPAATELFNKIISTFRFSTLGDNSSIQKSFRLRSRIKVDDSGIPVIYYSATGSSIIPGSRFNFWNIQISCPIDVIALNQQDSNICGEKQRIQGEQELRVSIKNLTGKSQSITAIGELLSEKDARPIATDKIDVLIDPIKSADFSIQASSPLVNTKWKLGTNQTLNWTTTPRVLQNARVYISLTGGPEGIEYNIASGISNTGSFSWLVGQYIYNSITNKTGGTLLPGSYQLKIEVNGIKKIISPIILEQTSNPSPFSILSGDNVFLAPNDGSLTIPVLDPSSGKGDPNLPVNDAILINNICKTFYNYYPDNFDFIVILTNIFGDADYNFPIKNSVNGIGRSVDDQSLLCGTKGTLKSIVSIYNFGNYEAHNFGDLMHEISHQWLMYISDPNLKITDSTGVHWSQFMDTATREDGFVYFSPNRGNPFIDNNDGTFSLDSTIPLPVTSFRKFNSMELYLMGLIPPSKVAPLTLWQTDSTKLSQTMKGTKKIVTVEDIINIAGLRVPAYPNTQRDFKIAYIILPKKGEIINSLTIDKAKIISTEFPKEWNFATRGLSNIK